MVPALSDLFWGLYNITECGMLPNSRHKVSPWEMLAGGWPLFNIVNGRIKHCHNSIKKKKKEKEGITTISTPTSQLYRSFVLISSVTTTLQFREDRCYFCCFFSKEGSVTEKWKLSFKVTWSAGGWARAERGYLDSQFNALSSRPHLLLYLYKRYQGLYFFFPL